MLLDEESLEIAANGGAIDPSKWPNLVEPLLERLQHNVYNVFPMPRVPPAAAQQPPLPSAATILAQNPSPSTTTSDSSANNSAETSIPPNLQTPPRPTATSSTTTPLSSERIPDSQPFSSQAASSSSTNSPTLPGPLDHLLTAISANIRTLFATKPPHTIQRLAELILRPTAHYRTLPAYLRAVDRVVSVTSPADIFPFRTSTGTHQPQHHQPNGTINGGGSAGSAGGGGAVEPSFMFSDHGLGSDESLGGALLTPIPWLHNTASSPEAEGEQEAAAGGHIGAAGDGASETGFSAQTTVGPTGGIDSGGSGAGGDVLAPTATGENDTENEVMGGMDSVPAESAVEDVPHARGPPVVGVEDMGLQDGKGVEMNLDGASGDDDDGRQQQQSQTQAPGQESSADQQGGQQQEQQAGQAEDQAQEGASKPVTDGDGDIALEDAKAEEGPATAEKEQQQKQG
ncbi:uncharacterized protein BO97DRAFT_474269 [Aspergillus homomorphus CBS 101889]|uniref:PPP4R2-domain-containing protein n=1 Tax=Aspergillus homomorphus (strain CBS 101889) TaxID=1450537 RepID=A0A395IAV7_ASPHC|nr:hypothetical protein BO97DRAFT_474269 [Aspergillus homomorphus CBS 101889]RAL17186.1 hypothetical protein BO97DRAFT_474269 [Aspergillus homomorphus CBS 101889]